MCTGTIFTCTQARYFRELLVMIFDQLIKCSSYILHKAFLILVPFCFLRIQVVTSKALYLITESGQEILVDASILLAKRCIRKGRMLDEIKQFGQETLVDGLISLAKRCIRTPYSQRNKTV